MTSKAKAMLANAVELLTGIGDPGNFARRIALCVLVSFVPASFAQSTKSIQAQAVLSIETQKPIAKVSPMLYGLMTEEINFSYDGGLYAELIRNRTFRTSWSGVEHWRILELDGAKATMSLDKTTGPSAAITSSLKFEVAQADRTSPAGIENEGYWGIPMRPNTTYRGSLYAKAAGTSIGAVTVSVVNDNTGAVVAAASVPALSSEWKQYNFSLKTGSIQSGSANHFRLTVERPGTAWFQLASLFPPTYNNRPNGTRIDLMRKMAAIKPAFLRFPGGNYLEGNHIAERFEWKKTIGSLVDRPTHPSPWGYWSSDGLGLLEFLEWCEDLKMQPVLAVYAGYSMAQEHVNPGAELEPYVQDVLDEIEYVIGDANTKWGAVRTRNGHPEPFPLTYVEIGNEDFFDKSGSYEGRYEQFYGAIKKRYPHLQLIATMPLKNFRPDVLDDHFYRSADDFYSDTTHYDKTDRKGPKIFVGEWATREGTPTPNFGAALGDAAWMTGMERNSDIVVMSAYAPLLVNVNPGGMQWDTDLVGYDATASYGSPSFYAQVLFSTHIGTEVVSSSLQGAGPRLFYSITRDAKKGVLYLKVVNASSAAQPLEIKLAGATKVMPRARLFSLSAHTTNETNTLLDPKRIVPVEGAINNVSADFKHTFPPYSISAVDVSLK